MVGEFEKFLLVVFFFLTNKKDNVVFDHILPPNMFPARSSSLIRRTGPQVAKAILARGAHKEIKFSNEGRAAMLAGVDILANAVSVTLGPKGKLVFTEGNTPQYHFGSHMAIRSECHH